MAEIEGGAAGGVVGPDYTEALKGISSSLSELKKSISENSIYTDKNKFIIEISSRLYANMDWINTTKKPKIMAKECIARATELYKELKNNKIIK